MIIFMSIGFADWLSNLKDIQNSRQNRSKNKLIRENAVTWAHGSCSLRAVGSCHHALEWKRNFVSAQPCNILYISNTLNRSIKKKNGPGR